MVLVRLKQRMAALLFGLALQTLLSEVIAGRAYGDAEVISSLRPSLTAMRRHFVGDGFRAAAPDEFSPDAAVHVSGGPAQSMFRDLRARITNFPNLRGKEEIAIYFDELGNAMKKVHSKAGSEAFRGYEEKGEFATNILVVSDTEAVVAGKFSLVGESVTAQGEILSETWARTSGLAPWRIRSAMYSWEQVSDLALFDKIFQAPAAAATTGDSATEAPATSKAEAPAASTAAVLNVNGTIVATTLTKLADESSGHGWSFVTIVVSLAMVGGFIEWRRRRKVAQWSSINSGGDIWLG